MSLVNCLKKAGELLSQEDRAALLASAAKYRKDGLKASEAGTKAVRDLLGEVSQQRTGAETSLKDAGPAIDASLAKNLEVTLPGSDERMSVAEALKKIDFEQQQDAQWAGLLKVATDCALGG